MTPETAGDDTRKGSAGAGDGQSGLRPEKVKRRTLMSRLVKGIRRMFFSSLTRRIAILNMMALAALLATILYVNQFSEGLIDARIESLTIQGKIIAGAIAGSATASPDAITIDPEKLLELKTGESLQPRLDPLDNLHYPISPEKVAPVLRALISPTQTRARIYDPDGLLILDSRFLYDAGRIQQFDLPPLDGEIRKRTGWTEWIGNMLNHLLRDRSLPTYLEVEGSGTQYPEVQAALSGESLPVVRVTKQGKLTVSVAVPVQRFRIVMGVLLLSTEGGDIDKIVREERLEILRVFLVAAIVMFILSALLASTIANPLRKLSEAALKVKRGVNSRISIPDFSYRNDEIGNLSNSVAEMTNSLYSRIEAIERFAADVSHELKNPLTSLRSAVETLPLAKKEEAQKRLLDVIQHDVKRLDRLITDISDASRLDADLVREKTSQLDFAQLLQDVINATQEVNHRKKKVKINLEISPPNNKNTNYMILGHDTRLGQVINNLVDNAISFVPESDGEVNIHLTKQSNWIDMIVEDNGPGIQAEDPNRIFERFYTDRSQTDGFGQNSGLGLSISKQIIEAHGGSIVAENRQNGSSGARFVIRLPVNQTKPDR